MECGVNSLHVGRQLKTDSSGADDFRIGVGTNVVKGKLARVQSQGIVPSGEPNTLSHLVLGRLLAVLVRLLLHSDTGLEKVAVSNGPDALASPDERFSRWDPHHLLLAGEKGWLIAKTSIEEGRHGRGGGVTVNGVLCPG